MIDKQWRASYSRTRVDEPSIYDLIRSRLGQCGTVLNVGCGTGSYEPRDAEVCVVGVDPSTSMLQQRSGRGVSVLGNAEDLPFLPGSFDAAMAVLTVHHWKDLQKGIGELERVSTDAIVILTYAPGTGESFWLTDDYLPGLGALDDLRFPALDEFCGLFTWPKVSSEVVPIPTLCADGFLEAFWSRPEMYLHTEVRANMSSFWLCEDDVVDSALSSLSRDLNDGTWDARWGHLRTKEWIDLGYRLVTAHR